MKLSTRLTIAMVALVLFTATAVAVFNYRDLEAEILPRALERLETSVSLRAADLESYVRGASADVLSLRLTTTVEGIIRADRAGGVDPLDGSSEDMLRARVARNFAGQLDAKASYFEFRIIGIQDGGRELVRADRSAAGGMIRIVPDDELQRKGERDYFQETLKLSPGAVYLSPIGLNEERDVPVLHVAASLQEADGQSFGIVVITIDMRAAFERIRKTVQPGGQTYLVNEQGDFLVHPDRRMEFGFELGHPYRLQDSFPALAAVLAAPGLESRTINDTTGEHLAVAAAPAQFAEASRAIVVEAMPYSQILLPAHAAQRSTLLIGVIAVAVAIALAVLMSRSLLRPLAEMTAAVQGFGRGISMTAPVSATGEVAVLARAFEQMAGEIKRSTAKLREYAKRERFYIAAVESSSFAFITADPDGVITAWNTGAESLFGYSADEAIGQHMVSIVPEEKIEEHRGNREKIRRLEHVTNFETVRLAKDGRRVAVVLNGSPIKSRAGTLLGSSLIARDVTAEKLAQEMFQLAVEACPNGMIMVDGAGRIVMVNTETERLFGYGRDELINTRIDLLVPESLRHQHLCQREAFTADPETRRMGAGRELFGRRSDGSEFPVEVALNPIATRNGTLILSVIVDISERQRNERLKDEFVSTVSHELRTPLTSIAGSLGLLTGGAAGQLAEPTMRLLKIAHKNSERLVRLINDILDIEKMESGKIVFDLKRVEVPALAEQAIEATRGYAENYGVRLRLDPDAADAFVRADPDRLMQVLTNLLSNAIKFSPRGEEVLVGVERHGDKVRITVRDYGIGISDEFRKRIFEKFAQADATDARQKSGTGLGLSIVKQIVTLLGGTVGFESVTNVGTTFQVDLPSWELVTGTSVLEAPAAEAPLHLLVVDDDAGVAHTISMRLAMNGFKSDIALRASEALSKAQTQRYDAILVDLKLPDRDGISLIQDLRSQPQYQNTPIVVISADAASGRDDIRSSTLDVLDWLNKPIDIAHLTAVIQRPIARNGSKRPHVLHVDDDEDVRGVVANAVGQTCAVTSVASIEAARAALAAQHFDLVVLDLLLSQASGLDLLPELRDRDGNALPVILYSVRAANDTNAAQVRAALTKSHKSIDHLVLTLRKHVAPSRAPAQQNREVA